jgi:translation initiation factor IF-2
VDVRFYNIIYEAVDDVRKAMEGLLAPTLKEAVLGTGEVRETFKISKLGTIAGVHILKGKFVRSAKARLIRDNIIVYDGRLASLKRFKDDAREVEAGYDCGTSLDKFNDLKVGDRIEVYRIEEFESKL